MKKRIVYPFLLLCLLAAAKPVFSQNIYDTIMPRINTDLQAGISTATLDANITTYKPTVQADGRWPDITDYYSSPQYDHLNRVADFARGYTRSGSIYRNDTSIYNRIVKTLQFWYNLNPYNSNWWFNKIWYPRMIGQILIMMRYGSSPLPATLETNLINRMQIGVITGGDGVNTSDEAMHFLYRSCLTQNNITLDSAVTYLFESISYDYNQGLMLDNSYSQHGKLLASGFYAKQLYIGGYGDGFIRNSYNSAGYLTGTRKALGGSKMAMLNNEYKNTFLKSSYKNFMDFNTGGRHQTRGSGIAHSRTPGVSAAYLADVRIGDPASNATWDSIIAGQLQTKPVHTHYWMTDYNMHIRPSFSFNVRTVSNRTIRSEKGNGDNLLGNFLTDGATCIQRIGGEYQSILPIWEWDKIPGITCRDFPTDVGSQTPVDWGSGGSMPFVGGVSDSLYGASVYDMNYNNVTAKKSCFYFDDEVVCLGAGIGSAQAENIITSVNQCWLYGDIQVKNSGTVSTIDDAANTANTYSSPQWVLHDSIGYFFPAGGNLTVSNKLQSGSWRRINSNESTTALSGPVFNMWLNHGVGASNTNYAYVVVPGLGASTMATYNLANIKVVKNTDSVQAVRHLGLDMMQVVFYKPGTFIDGGIYVAVDKPCILLFKDISTAQVKLSVADPLQTATAINVAFMLPGITGGAHQIDCNLPTGNYKGSSAAFILNNTAAANAPIISNAVYEIALALNGTSNLDVKNADTANLTKVQLYAANGTLAQQWKAVSVGGGYYKLVSQLNTTKCLDVNGGGSANGTQVQIYTDNGSNAQKWLITNIGGANYTLTPACAPNSMLDDSAVSVTNGTKIHIWGANGGNAQKWTFRQVIVTSDSVNATADAFVRNGTYATTNNGNSAVLAIKNDAVDYARETYLKFDLSSVPANVVIARLRLYVSYANTSASSSSWQLWKGSSNSWTETGINWNNKPAASGLVAAVPGQGYAGYCYWDVTSQLRNIGSDSMLTLKVTSTVFGSVSDAGFSSKEIGTASQRPVILFTSNQSQADALMAMQQAPKTVSVVVKPSPEEQLGPVRIFPNPATNNCVVQSDALIKSVTVTNAAGVAVKKVAGTNSKQLNMSLVGLPVGTYFLIVNGDKQQQKKLFKIK